MDVGGGGGPLNIWRFGSFDTHNHFQLTTTAFVYVCVCRPQNVGPNEPGHGATEAMDENLSQEDGEEQLKKPANDPLIIPVDPVTRDVDNRLLEEQGLMVLTPKDIILEKNHLGKYEAEQKGKEALDMDVVGARPQPLGLLDNRAVNDLDVRGTLASDLPPARPSLSAPPLEQKKGAMLGERGVESKGLLDMPDPSAPGAYKSVLQVGALGQLKFAGDGSPPQGAGDKVAEAGTNGRSAHLVSSTPRVSHTISGANPQHKGADTPVLHIADGQPRDGGAAAGNKTPPHKAVGVLLPQASLSKETELENGEEGGHDGYQVSRAVVTFALQEDKTHTIGDDDEGVDENATRAAPFTMASQWQGISALGSSGEEDSDNALDDVVTREGLPRISRSRSRQLAMNTLADEDDNFESMARNSLVLLDERDCLDPLRGSQVFEDDDSHLSQLIQACKDEVGGEGKLYPPLLSTKHQDSPRTKPTAADLPPKPVTSSPRKMPEKLAKDMGNRIGSPLKQGPGSPSKLLFKMRESEEKKGLRPVSKLVATGKPPLHQPVKRDKPPEVPKTPSANGNVTTFNSASTKPNEAQAVGTKDFKVASAVGSGSASDKGVVDVHNLTSHALSKPILKDKWLEGSGGSDGPKELKSILKVESNVAEVAQSKTTADIARGRPTTNGTNIARRDSSPRKLSETDKDGNPRRASVPTESKIPVSSSRLLATSTASEVKRSSPPTKIPVRAGPTKSVDNRKRSVSASRVERSTQELADIPECVSPLNLDDDSPVPRPPPGLPKSSMSNAR